MLEPVRSTNTRLVALALLCGTVAVGMPYITALVAGTDSRAVHERFLERGVSYASYLERASGDAALRRTQAGVASDDATYTSRDDAEALREWVRSEGAAARRYVAPVLFPLDVVFMAAFAGLVGCGSAALTSGNRRRLQQLLLVLPATIYLVADFVEGIVLAVLLRQPELISPPWMSATHAITVTKIAAFAVAFVEILVLSARRAWSGAGRADKAATRAL